MLQRAEQEHVEMMLKQSIPLLCQSGLQSVKHLRIQGTLGVTMDHSHCFMVQIDTKFNTAKILSEDREETAKKDQKNMDIEEEEEGGSESEAEDTKDSPTRKSDHHPKQEIREVCDIKPEPKDSEDDDDEEEEEEEEKSEKEQSSDKATNKPPGIFNPMNIGPNMPPFPILPNPFMPQPGGFDATNFGAFYGMPPPAPPTAEEFEKMAPKQKARVMLAMGTLPDTSHLEEPKEKKEKRDRKELCILEKMKVIQERENGKSQRELAKMFDIGRTQVHGILKRKKNYLQAMNMNCDLLRKRAGTKRCTNEEINAMTYQWYVNETSTKGPVSGIRLQEKALQFAKYLGFKDFKASNGWLSAFKRRHRIITSHMKTPEGMDGPRNFTLDPSFPHESFSQTQQDLSFSESSNTTLEQATLDTSKLEQATFTPNSTTPTTDTNPQEKEATVSKAPEKQAKISKVLVSSDVAQESEVKEENAKLQLSSVAAQDKMRTQPYPPPPPQAAADTPSYGSHDAANYTSAPTHYTGTGTYSTGNYGTGGHFSTAGGTVYSGGNYTSGEAATFGTYPVTENFPTGDTGNYSSGRYSSSYNVGGNFSSPGNYSANAVGNYNGDGNANYSVGDATNNNDMQS